MCVPGTFQDPFSFSVILRKNFLLELHKAERSVVGTPLSLAIFEAAGGGNFDLGSAHFWILVRVGWLRAGRERGWVTLNTGLETRLWPQHADPPRASARRLQRPQLARLRGGGGQVL